jgi:hypothetical protein
MATKSDLFYDPFAERCEKPEGLDFKFSKDREPKNGIGSNGSANGEESHNDEEQVTEKTNVETNNCVEMKIEKKY